MDKFMISSQTYSEVYEILKYMNKEVVMKIPIEILEKIKNKRDLNYKSKIDKEDIFNPDNVLPETIEVLNWIDVNFWMSEDKKEKIQKKVRKQELEENKLKEKKYNPDAIFKNVNKKETTNVEEPDNKITDTLLTEYKESFFTRFKNFVFKILYINQ